MRGIQTREFFYLFNPWSDGKRKFATATTGTASYRQMVKRAANEPAIAARLQLFDHRVPEEFYQITSDPSCLENLIGYTEQKPIIDRLRQTLAGALAATNDPVAPLLADVDDLDGRAAFMAREDSRAAATRRAKQQRRLPADNKNAASNRQPRGALEDAQ
jgi:N-sulfoglucosamine sulfohydrolase